MTITIAVIAALTVGLLSMHTIDALDQLRKAVLMSTQEAIDAITEQLVKAQREIVSRIADVQAQLDAAGVAEQIDLSSLTSAAQALDDVVPDDVDEEPPTEGVDAG